MTLNEVIRIRERLLQEFDSSTTRLIPTTQDGYLLEWKFGGETLILSSEEDIDRAASRVGRVV